MKFLKFLFNLLRFDRANWKAIGLCIFAAVVFWIFNAFNKNYSANITFPVVFEFDNEKFVPADVLPKSIRVNVNGNGWDLFRKQIGVKVPQITITLERASEIKKIVTSSLIPVVASQIGTLKVNFVVTDTLRINIDKKIITHAKLATDLSKVSFQAGYGQTSPVVVLPDSIKLEGAESLIRSLENPIQLRVEGKAINEDFRDEVEIDIKGKELIKIEPSIAQVMFEVGEVIQLEKRIKIKADGSLKNVLPDSVKVKFQLPLNRAEDFNRRIGEVFSLVEKEGALSGAYIPTLSNLPPYVIVLHIDSVKVKRPI